MKWQLSVFYLVSIWPNDNCKDQSDRDLLPGKRMLNLIPEFLSKSGDFVTQKTSEVTDILYSGESEIDITAGTPEGPPPPHFVHAGLPRGLAVTPLPLPNSDHELSFNVTWDRPMGGPVRDYSIEITGLTKTVDCKTHICYEYDIPGSALWWMLPAFASPIAESCAIRPGCAYAVKLIPHPWDGHTSANMIVELDECVSGVCSCAHAPRLPAPEVQASLVSIHGEIFANITWNLPQPTYPQRLPPNLNKLSYFVSISKQMVSDAHPAPWFAHAVSRKVDAEGPIAKGDSTRWLLLPINERSDEQSGQRANPPKRLTLDVKLLARVNVIDDRECVGPAGNATAYDPKQAHKELLRNYILWALFGVVCILCLVAVVAVTAMKRFVLAFRSAPVSAQLEPLCRRPAWFPLQLRNPEGTTRGQVVNSPLYSHKEYEVEDEEGSDEWEVPRSRVQLGMLIGSGAFGRVHAAQLDVPREGTIVVAAKMLTEDAIEEEVQDFLREIEMLKHVGSHKHVIRLIACCTKRQPIIALLEHAPRGDLLTLLKSARGSRKETQGSNDTRRVDSDIIGRPSEADTEYTNISDCDPPDCKHGDKDSSSKDHYVAEPALHLDCSTMREYALQVALGMRHLEDRGITHRDLAARNILVDGAGTLKVADFGLSRAGIYVHTRSRPVPLRWLAPEAILHSQYSTPSDVWAFAVLLWEIATLGGFPYSELSNHHIPSFLTGGGRLPKPARASNRLYQLMVHCWSEDPNNRPTFSQIVNNLTAQQQLYVDLDCIFPSADDDVVTALSEKDFDSKIDR